MVEWERLAATGQYNRAIYSSWQVASTIKLLAGYQGPAGVFTPSTQFTLQKTRPSAYPMMRSMRRPPAGQCLCERENFHDQCHFPSDNIYAVKHSFSRWIHCTTYCFDFNIRRILPNPGGVLPVPWICCCWSWASFIANTLPSEGSVC